MSYSRGKMPKYAVRQKPFPAPTPRQMLRKRAGEHIRKTNDAVRQDINRRLMKKK